MNVWVWIGSSIFFFIMCSMLGILFYLIFSKTHLAVELKARGSAIGLFFQDNKFVEWKPVSIINGIVYDEYYGPFIVTATYVDKKTKNIMIPFDVDMDGDRSSNIKELVNQFRNITTNEKSINELRQQIITSKLSDNKNIKNLTSHIKYNVLKTLFLSSTPHNVKSKIEKMVAMRVQKFQNINPLQAVIVFGAIFGIIVIGAILLKTMGITGTGG